MNGFKLKVVATNKTFYDGECVKLIVNAPDGQLEILANHEPAVLAVVPGMARFSKDDTDWTEAVCGNGFVMVSANEVVLLVDTAERPEDIDAIRAREAKERAEEQLRHQTSRKEYLHSKASLARAMDRLKATSKYQ